MSYGVPGAVGRYQIRGEIGRGAMGAVYRAHDPKLGREVAVKLIASAVASGEDRSEVAARFEREARVAAQLHHPNVVSVYDAGSEDGTLYLVMELVDGDTLSHRLTAGDFPATAEALDIAAQAADALAAAHEAGVIHRDIKPGNLLLGRGGRVKVSDFGVAKAIGEKTDLTRTGMMVGSPAYMAPEQVKGMPLDGRSDLFSLGVVLYEMVVRRKPFPADTVTALVYQILHEDPLQEVSASGLSRELSDFLRWTLAKDREARIPDARTFAARARALAAGDATTAAATAPTKLMPQAPTRTAPAAVAPPAAPAAISTTAHAPVRGGRPGLWLAAGFALAIGLVAALWLSRAPKAPEVGRTTAEEPARVALPLAQPEAPPPVVATAPAPEPEKEGPAPAPKPAPVVAVPVAVAPTPAVAPPPVEPAPAAIEPAPAPAPAPEPSWAGVFSTRRAAEFHVDPEDAHVSVDGRPIGVADDWDGVGGGKSYAFATPGEYRIELSLSGYRTAWVKVVVAPDAREDVVDIDTELAEIEE